MRVLLGCGLHEDPQLFMLSWPSLLVSAPLKELAHPLHSLLLHSHQRCLGHGATEGVVLEATMSQADINLCLL